MSLSSCAPTPAAARRKPRTEKEKARELLRRKRAGEPIDELEESDEEDEVAKPLYDLDPDYMVLDEFLDDEEGVLEFSEPPAQERSPKKKSPRKKGKTIRIDSDSGSDVNHADEDRSGDEDSEEDFVVDDGNIGVPDEVMRLMPHEFTSHALMRHEDHFCDVIEWLVENRINPGFANKKHEKYWKGWQRLNDEVRGLAESKFASSAWLTSLPLSLSILMVFPFFLGDFFLGDLS